MAKWHKQIFILSEGCSSVVCGMQQFCVICLILIVCGQQQQHINAVSTVFVCCFCCPTVLECCCCRPHGKSMRLLKSAQYWYAGAAVRTVLVCCGCRPHGISMRMFAIRTVLVCGCCRSHGNSMLLLPSSRN